MPDIQTALSRALTEWSKDEPDQQEKAPMQKPHYAITNNVTRATFEFVRDNPGSTYRGALTALVAQGYKESSITALFSQMRRAGLLVRDADDRYTAVGTEYKPMKASEKSNHKSVKHFTDKPVKPPKAEPTFVFAPAPAPVVTVNDVDYLLNTLPIKQARELYDALHRIFGGAK